MEILVFPLAITSSRLCLPVYNNLMCSSQKMSSIPLYIWRVLKLMSCQVILSVHFCLHLMLTYVVGVIYAIRFKKFSNDCWCLRPKEVTFWQFVVIVWFVFPFHTVLYGVQFFCHDVSMQYLMQWRWKKNWETLKIQNQERAVRKSVFSRNIIKHNWSFLIFMII